MLDNNLPVTTIVKRKIKPGKEAEYEDLIKYVSQYGISFPGNAGINFIKPTKDDPYHTIVFRFDSVDHLNTWGQSKIRKNILEKIDAITVEEPIIKQYNSLEHWFELEETANQKPPAKYKMVIATIIGIYPVTTILLPAMRKTPYLKLIFGENFWVASLVSTIIVVYLMTYIVMPFVTRALKSWLFK